MNVLSQLHSPLIKRGWCFLEHRVACQDVWQHCDVDTLETMCHGTMDEMKRLSCCITHNYMLAHNQASVAGSAMGPCIHQCLSVRPSVCRTSYTALSLLILWQEIWLLMAYKNASKNLHIHNCEQLCTAVQMHKNRPGQKKTQAALPKTRSSSAEDANLALYWKRWYQNNHNQLIDQCKKVHYAENSSECYTHEIMTASNQHCCRLCNKMFLYQFSHEGGGLASLFYNNNNNSICIAR